MNPFGLGANVLTAAARHETNSAPISNLQGKRASAHWAPVPSMSLAESVRVKPIHNFLSVGQWLCDREHNIGDDFDMRRLWVLRACLRGQRCWGLKHEWCSIDLGHGHCFSLWLLFWIGLRPLAFRSTKACTRRGILFSLALRCNRRLCFVLCSFHWLVLSSNCLSSVTGRVLYRWGKAPR